MRVSPLIPNRYWTILFIFLTIVGILLIYNTLSRKSTIMYSSKATSIELGLSIVEQDPSAILDQLPTNSDTAAETKSNSITSFLLQSSAPAAQIFLDYIFIPNDGKLPTPFNLICFDKIVTKSHGAPVQLFSNSSLLSNLTVDGDSYIYKFQNERCAPKGTKNIVPHILLGIVPVESRAIGTFIKGFQASHFFPFDRQNIPLDITVETDEFEAFSPSLTVVIAQKGWDGVVKNGALDTPTLQLKRFLLYRIVFGVFFVIMIITIAFLNHVLPNGVLDKGNYLQITFGLLLGLWGLHQMLKPTYIDSSTLIDIAIYTLYLLVLVKLLKITIVRYEREAIDREP